MTAPDRDDVTQIPCPTCGYYCLGKGGHGCIDKPGMVALTRQATDHGATLDEVQEMTDRDDESKYSDPRTLPHCALRIADALERIADALESSSHEYRHERIADAIEAVANNCGVKS